MTVIDCWAGFYYDVKAQHITARKKYLELLSSRWHTMIELVLRDNAVVPIVERLSGPRVRLTINTGTDLAHCLEQCRDELQMAIEWALTSLYNDAEAPSRVYVRDAQGQEVLAMVDPCTFYGLQAIIRP